MRQTLEQFIYALSNPETASSVFPLATVVGIFLLASAGSIYFFVRALRVPEEPGAEPLSSRRSILEFLNTSGRFARRLLTVFSASEERVSELLAQILVLKKQVAELESSKNALQFENEKLQNRGASFQSTISTLEQKNEELRTRIRSMDTHRDKLEARIEDLQADLREVTTEVDSMHAQNAKALEAANDRRLQVQKRGDEIETQLTQFLGELEKFYKNQNDQQSVRNLGERFAGFAPLPSTGQSAAQQLERTITQQAEQIRKLKELLQVCRTQIVTIQKRMSSAPSKSV